MSKKPPKPRFKKYSKLAVIGTGLIGGSILMAVKKRKLAETTTAYDISPKARALCKKLKLATVCSSAKRAVKGADIVVICTPIDATIGVLRDISFEVSRETLVTDVGSVKEYKADGDTLTSIIYDSSLWYNSFVGSHPIAGSEKSGLENASADLFKGKDCYVMNDASPLAQFKATMFWNKLGMNVYCTHPVKHDQTVAYTSHLPQLLALSLHRTVELSPLGLYLEGEGYKDMTRLAKSDPSMWIPILRANKDNIIKAIGDFEDRLAEIKLVLEADNPDLLPKLFTNSPIIAQKPL